MSTRNPLGLIGASICRHSPSLWPGRERHDGEAPFTYCLEAHSREEAIQAAIEHHTAELDEDAADDLIVIEGESYPGEPRGGYWWNDLREKRPDLNGD